MDDVRDLEHLVEQSDVPVSEVDRGTGCGGEVVVGTNRCRNDQVVDDFTIDLRDHLVGHQVGESGLGVDVVNRLEVLSSFQRPRSLELTSDSGNRVAVDAQGDFRLEGVGFKVVLVVHASDSPIGEGTSGERDLNSTGRVVESRRAISRGIDFKAVGEGGAITNDDDFGVTIGIETNAEARGRVFTLRIGFLGALEHLNNHGTGEDGSVRECRIDDHSTSIDDCIFTVDLLRGVVRVQRPSVLAREVLRRVLTHDLRTSNRLALIHGVTIPDVEDQARGLTHRLDTDKVVSDELGIALAKERQGESREVGDIRGRGLVLEDDRSTFGIPGFVLVFEQCCHEPNLLLGNFTAFGQNGCPFLDALIFPRLVQDGRPVRITRFGDGPWGVDLLAALGEMLRTTRGTCTILTCRQHGVTPLV